MWKAINSPLGIGILGGAGGNALWAAISNVSTLKPYLPAVTAAVPVPMWVIVAVTAIVILAVPRYVVAWIRRPRAMYRAAEPVFVPNETEVAVVVLLRAQDRTMSEGDIVSWVVDKAPDHIGRQDVRLAIKTLHAARWLSFRRISFDEAGYSLTEPSLAFANKHSIKPIKAGYA